VNGANLTTWPATTRSFRAVNDETASATNFPRPALLSKRKAAGVGQPFASGFVIPDCRWESPAAEPFKRRGLITGNDREWKIGNWKLAMSYVV